MLPDARRGFDDRAHAVEGDGQSDETHNAGRSSGRPCGSPVSRGARGTRHVLTSTLRTATWGLARVRSRSGASVSVTWSFAECTTATSRTSVLVLHRAEVDVERGHCRRPGQDVVPRASAAGWSVSAEQPGGERRRRRAVLQQLGDGGGPAHVAGDPRRRRLALPLRHHAVQQRHLHVGRWPLASPPGGGAARTRSARRGARRRSAAGRRTGSTPRGGTRPGRPPRGAACPTAAG